MTRLHDISMRIRRDLFQAYPALLILVIYAVITQLSFGTVCLFAILTGFPCPGCGLTHAGFALLSGHFQRAAQWNATIFLWSPYILYLLFFRYVLGKTTPFFIPVTIAVGTGTWIYYGWRLLTGVIPAVPCPGIFSLVFPCTI